MAGTGSNGQQQGHKPFEQSVVRCFLAPEQLSCLGLVRIGLLTDCGFFARIADLGSPLYCQFHDLETGKQLPVSNHDARCRLACHLENLNGVTVCGLLRQRPPPGSLPYSTLGGLQHNADAQHSNGKLIEIVGEGHRWREQLAVCDSRTEKELFRLPGHSEIIDAAIILPGGSRADFHFRIRAQTMGLRPAIRALRCPRLL